MKSKANFSTDGLSADMIREIAQEASKYTIENEAARVQVIWRTVHINRTMIPTEEWIEKCRDMRIAEAKQLLHELNGDIL